MGKNMLSGHRREKGKQRRPTSRLPLAKCYAKSISLTITGRKPNPKISPEPRDHLFYSYFGRAILRLSQALDSLIFGDPDPYHTMNITICSCWHRLISISFFSFCALKPMNFINFNHFCRPLKKAYRPYIYSLL